MKATPRKMSVILPQLDKNNIRIPYVPKDVNINTIYNEYRKMIV